MKTKIECAEPNCDKDAETGGYCPKHYQQVRRHGRLTPEWEYAPAGVCRACGNKAIAKNLCMRHYQQVRRYGRLTPERESRHVRHTGCKVPGCKEPHSSRGFCARHYQTKYYLPMMKRKRRQKALAVG